jgi:hypothetical protein
LIQQQELLSKESDHRLLNGLQMIVGLLSLQSRAAANADLEAEIECLEAQGVEVLDYLNTINSDLPEKFDSLVDAVRMVIEPLLEDRVSNIFVPTNGIVPYPSHWPKHFNGFSREACDMLIGPCCCGATHFKEEDWVREAMEKHNAQYVHECEQPARPPINEDF